MAKVRGEQRLEGSTLRATRSHRKRRDVTTPAKSVMATVQAKHELKLGKYLALYTCSACVTQQE